MSRAISTSLIVDDFGVKYTNTIDVKYQVAALSTVYEVHID